MADGSRAALQILGQLPCQAVQHTAAQCPAGGQSEHRGAPGGLGWWCWMCGISMSGMQATSKVLNGRWRCAVSQA